MSKKSRVSVFDMQFVTAGISTTLVLLLLGLVAFFVLAAHNLSVYVRENISFSILVSDNMKERDILQLQKQLSRQPFVRYTEYISKEQAQKEYIETMGIDPQEFVGYNPLTASIEIKLKSDYANADSIARIEQLIKQDSNVREVSYRKELVNAVNDNIRKISLSLLALAVVLTLISFALINNTIRLTIYSQRFLIHTMKLVGASWAFIRRPFLLRNLWIGGGGLRARTGEGGDAARHAAGVGGGAGIGGAHHVAVCLAVHQQVFADEGGHAVLYLNGKLRIEN